MVYNHPEQNNTSIESDNRNKRINGDKDIYDDNNENKVQQINDNYERWLREEFVKLHDYIDKKPIPISMAYREISRQIIANMTNKSNVKVDAKEDLEIKIVLVDQYAEKEKDH